MRRKSEVYCKAGPTDLIPNREARKGMVTADRSFS